MGLGLIPENLHSRYLFLERGCMHADFDRRGPSARLVAQKTISSSSPKAE